MREDPDPSHTGSFADGPIEIQITVEDPVWHDLVPGLADLIDRVLRAALDHDRTRDAGARASELSVLLSNDLRVREINHAYRSRDKATNVLAFAYGDAGEAAPADCLGDVILARETIGREAAEQDKTVEDHLSHLLVHGLLHLCGFDHETDFEAEEMEALEREILAEIGIADPYRSAPALAQVDRAGAGSGRSAP